MGIIEAIEQYLATTPPEIMGAHVLLFIAPLILASVLIWGFQLIWIDMKQGQYAGAIKWVMLSVNVPQDAMQSPKGMENFFNLLAGSKSAITWKEKWLNGKFQAYFSFEIASVDGRISFYIRTPIKYRDLIEAAFYAQYPEAQIVEVTEDYTDFIPNEYPDEEYDAWGSEMTTRKANYLPIKTYELFEHQGEKDLRFKDPLLSMLENMGKMRVGESYMIQFLIMQPDEQDWVKEGRAYIEKLYGIEKPKKKGWVDDAVGWLPQEIMRQATGAEFGGEEAAAQDNFKAFKITPEERDQMDAIKEKISKLGWLTKIRFVYVAKRELFRKGTIASMTKGTFHQYAHQNWNKLGIHGPATPKDDYFFQEWAMPSKQKGLISRYKNRSFAGGTPFIMNTAELATLFHFPPADARTPVLTSLGARRSEAPIELDFAAEGAAILSNVDRTSTADVQDGVPGIPTKAVSAGPLTVPSISSPTAGVSTIPAPSAANPGVDVAFDQSSPAPAPPVAMEAELDPGMPRAGMPAPLPPGLDLNDQSRPPTDVPENLPLDQQ